MRIRKVRLGRELRRAQDGAEQVRCPRCRATWLVRSAGSADAGTCGHLRFTWYVGIYGGTPEHAGNWAHAELEREFAARYRRLTHTPDDPGRPLPAMFDVAVMRSILRSLAHPEVEEAWYYPFVESDDQVCAEAAIFWGIGAERLPDPEFTPFPSAEE